MRMEFSFCALFPPLFCVYNPSAGQTMWNDIWILILPLLSFVSIWHGNQYFFQGKWTKSRSAVYTCAWLRNGELNDSHSWFSLTLIIVLSAEDTSQGLCHCYTRSLTWISRQSIRKVSFKESTVTSLMLDGNEWKDRKLNQQGEKAPMAKSEETRHKLLGVLVTQDILNSSSNTWWQYIWNAVHQRSSLETLSLTS